MFFRLASKQKILSTMKATKASLKVSLGPWISSSVTIKETMVCLRCAIPHGGGNQEVVMYRPGWVPKDRLLEVQNWVLKTYCVYATRQCCIHIFMLKYKIWSFHNHPL